MTLLSFCGYALIGLGPAVILLGTALRKPFLVIVVLASAFFWLVALMLAGLPAKVLSLGGDTFSLHALVLVLSVLIEEGIRYFFWKVVKFTERAVDVLAERQSKAKLTSLNKLAIYLASGLGHGLAHSLMFFLSLLTPTLGAATYYVDTCPQMPFFLAAALSSLGFLMLHMFAMVVALDGYSSGRISQVLFVLGLHLVAGLLMLQSALSCRLSVASSLLSGFVSLLSCSLLVWHRTSGYAPLRNEPS